jgi:type II secretory pathway pseudopilin PulG
VVTRSASAVAAVELSGIDTCSMSSRVDLRTGAETTPAPPAEPVSYVRPPLLNPTLHRADVPDVTHEPCHRAESGFSLVEVLVAATILVVGILATAMVVSGASRANAVNRQRDAATNLAREVIEGVRTVPYDRITHTGISAELQTLPGLQDTDGGGYGVSRGGLVFNVAVDVCIVDDPADGGGPRVATTTFCASSTPAGTEDPNPEDYKKVSATITWRQSGGRTTSVVQSGIINNPGSASGPAVRSIAPRGYEAPFLVTEPLTTVTFDLTTSSKPHVVNWLLDGTVKTPGPVMNGTSGLAWTFTWDIGPVEGGVLDGDYIVSGEAFNQYGVSGPGRQETIILNRRRPFAPRQVTGGRTGFGTVEIEWTANSERDIVGYEVYREEAAGLVTVCPLASQKLDTVCVDTHPPGDAAVKYRVSAYDKDPFTGVPRVGDASSWLTVVTDNRPPYAPTDLTATRAADGVVTFTWKRPSPEDPDAQDGVEFYRVYRDGQTLAHRYARWFDSRSTVTWQDMATDGTTHTYWVSAVDRHYAESPLEDGVTR